MISLKQQIAYDMACDIARAPEHHDPIPADVQQQLDADIQEALAKLQAFMTEDTVKAFAFVAIGQERALTTINVAGGAAAILAIALMNQGAKVAAEMMEDEIKQVLAHPRGLDLFLEARAEKEFYEKKSWND